VPAVLYGCGIWPCVQERGINYKTKKRSGLDTDRVVGTAEVTQIYSLFFLLRV
jgi:hypothetical protein